MHQKICDSSFVAIILVFMLLLPTSCRKTRARSEAAIKELKDGAVLVRLHTSELQIKILKEADKIIAAKRVEKDLEARNIEIMAAFRDEFKFCPVYFFFSNHSERIRQNKIDSVFVNNRLKIDYKIKPATENVLILDVGFIYFQAFSSSTEGIIVMDKQFNPLERPFPYYVRRSKPIPVLSKRMAEMVEELNHKLAKYYRKLKL